MAKTSFKFAADLATVSNSNYAARYFTQAMHTGIGESDAAQSVSVGNPLTNSGLSNPLAATDGNGDSLAGTHCRAWSWDNAAVGAQYRDANGGTAVLTDAAGGSLYPVTATPAAGTFVSYSVRGFLRINAHTVSATTKQGAMIGFQIKGKDAEGVDPHLFYQYTTGNDPQYGYTVSLGSLKTNDDGASQSDFQDPGLNSTNLTLAFSCNNATTPTSSGEKKVVASGTYVFDTWYHVRFDCIPSIASDTIKVYTAPVSGVGSAAVAGLGSETWTEVITTDITAGDDAYRAWNNSTYDRVGYFWSINASSAAGDGTSAITKANAGRHVPCIEKFQFLADDIS